MTIVPGFIRGLVALGIARETILVTLGVSKGHLSMIESGDRSVTLADFFGLLSRLVADYPSLRLAIVEAALGDVLASLGCRLVATSPTPANTQKVVDLAAWRASRGQRMAA